MEFQERFGNPFYQTGKRWGRFYDDIRWGHDFGGELNPNPIYQPVDRFGRSMIATVGASVLSLLPDMYVPGEGPKPDTKIDLPNPKMGRNAKKKSKTVNNNNNQKKKQTKKWAPRRRPQEAKSRKPPPKKPQGRQKSVRMGTGNVKSERMPAAFGSIVSGSSYRFIKARSYNCMRMVVRFWLGQLVADGTSGLLQFLITNASGGGTIGNTGGQWYLNPANSFYMSNAPFYSLAGMFQTYFVMKARLLGFTKQATSSAGTISAGTSHDPNYFETSGSASATTNPTKRMVTEMYDAQTFPVWQPSWAVNFRASPSTEYYVRGPQGANTAYTYADNSSNQRLAYSHVAGFNYDGKFPATGETTPLVDVYAELDIELCDFCSQFTTSPTFVSTSERLRKLEEALERLDDFHDRIEKVETKSKSNK